LSAVESSEDFRTAVLAKRSRRRPASWIIAAGHRLHLQLCAAHGWATRLDGFENPSLYHIARAAIGPLLVLAKSALERAIERTMKRHRGRRRTNNKEKLQ